jgi:Peptidase family S41
VVPVRSGGTTTARPTAADAPTGLIAAQRGVLLSSTRARVGAKAVAKDLIDLTGEIAPLTWAQRLDIIDTWQFLLSDLYVHLSLKRSLYGFDPLRALEHLRTLVPILDDNGFHREMVHIINRLRDAHTQYLGPTRTAGKVAALPFTVETYGPVNAPVAVVTKIVPHLLHDRWFKPGVTIQTWNAVPFARAVDLYAETLTGGRPDSRLSRALETLTQRPLEYLPAPDELWVDLTYTGETRPDPQTIRLEWRLVEPGASPLRGIGMDQRGRMSVYPIGEVARRARKLLFAGPLWAAERAAGPAQTTRAKPDPLESQFPDSVSARKVTVGRRSYGVLRLWSFDVAHDGAYLEDVARLLEALPGRGLIIDLRSNPGGFVVSAERLLQLFTPQRIRPTRFAMRATTLTRDLANATRNQGDLGPWSSSLNVALSMGEQYSQHLAFTSDEAANNVGQRYGGPVVCVVDANTFSSGDLFTAGFADNQIGPIIVVGNATGAGGANVWGSDDVEVALAAAGRTLPPLPDGVSYTIAVRRAIRSGDADGTVIEDIGISGQPYEMTRADVLGSNDDLLKYCVALLDTLPRTRMDVHPRGVGITVDTEGLDRLDITYDGHPHRSVSIADGTRTLDKPAGTLVEVTGWADNTLRQQRILR